MTFSNKVREEISKTLHDKERKFACLYGILLYSRKFTNEYILIQTESDISIDILERLVKDIFVDSVKPEPVKDEYVGKRLCHNFSILGKEKINKIKQVYGIDYNERKIDNSQIINGGMAELIAGIFLATGSMSDPQKEYHLEFNVPTEKLCYDLQDLLKSIGVKSGYTAKKSTFIVYLESEENIEDFLTFIGATQSTIELMNINIYKNVRNKTNRITNCDVANLNKTVDASIRQIRDINTIKKNNYFEKLSPELRELCELRLENEDLSLEELGKMLTKPIGKSGVSRRFQKIRQIAENLPN